MLIPFSSSYKLHIVANQRLQSIGISDGEYKALMSSSSMQEELGVIHRILTGPTIPHDMVGLNTEDREILMCISFVDGGAVPVEWMIELHAIMETVPNVKCSIMEVKDVASLFLIFHTGSPPSADDLATYLEKSEIEQLEKTNDG